eukprot:8424366-Alexandrium_andersonii.AAC.1
MATLQDGPPRFGVRDSGDRGADDLALRLVLRSEVVRHGPCGGRGVAASGGHKVPARREDVLAVGARSLGR